MELVSFCPSTLHSNDPIASKPKLSGRTRRYVIHGISAGYARSSNTSGGTIEGEKRKGKIEKKWDVNNKRRRKKPSILRRLNEGVTTHTVFSNDSNDKLSYSRERGNFSRRKNLWREYFASCAFRMLDPPSPPLFPSSVCTQGKENRFTR